MRRLFFLVALVLLCQWPSAASKDPAKQQEAIKKIQVAVANTNIFDLPSFRVKANVQVESQGKLVAGSYQLLWNGPDQWREEIQLPGYAEIQVGGHETVWIQRSTDFYPLPVYHLHSALGFGSSPGGPGLGPASLVQSGLTPKDNIKKIRERKEHGETHLCVEYDNETKRVSEICVNEATQTLIRSSPYVDKDFQPVGGGKVYPRFLSFVEDDKVLARIEIVEFTIGPRLEPNSFTPPTGVPPTRGCMNPVPARLIKKVSPEYPETARQRRVEGTVSADVRITVDGIPKIGQVVGHASPDLEQSSIRALRDWRYEPALCQTSPVEIETVLQVNYSLYQR